MQRLEVVVATKKIIGPLAHTNRSSAKPAPTDTASAVVRSISSRCACAHDLILVLCSRGCRNNRKGVGLLALGHGSNNTVDGNITQARSLGGVPAARRMTTQITGETLGTPTLPVANHCEPNTQPCWERMAHGTCIVGPTAVIQMPPRPLLLLVLRAAKFLVDHGLPRFFNQRRRWNKKHWHACTRTNLPRLYPCILLPLCSRSCQRFSALLNRTFLGLVTPNGTQRTIGS